MALDDNDGDGINRRHALTDFGWCGVSFGGSSELGRAG
jgi:hypothetical protein